MNQNNNNKQFDNKKQHNRNTNRPYVNPFNSKHHVSKVKHTSLVSRRNAQAMQQSQQRSSVRQSRPQNEMYYREMYLYHLKQAHEQQKLAFEYYNRLTPQLGPQQQIKQIYHQRQLPYHPRTPKRHYNQRAPRRHSQPNPTYDNNNRHRDRRQNNNNNALSDIHIGPRLVDAHITPKTHKKIKRENITSPKYKNYDTVKQNRAAKSGIIGYVMYKQRDHEWIDDTNVNEYSPELSDEYDKQEQQEHSELEKKETANTNDNLSESSPLYRPNTSELSENEDTHFVTFANNTQKQTKNTHQSQNENEAINVQDKYVEQETETPHSPHQKQPIKKKHIAPKKPTRPPIPHYGSRSSVESMDSILQQDQQQQQQQIQKQNQAQDEIGPENIENIENIEKDNIYSQIYHSAIKGEWANKTDKKLQDKIKQVEEEEDEEEELVLKLKMDNIDINSMKSINLLNKNQENIQIVTTSPSVSESRTSHNTSRSKSKSNASYEPGHFLDDYIKEKAMEKMQHKLVAVEQQIYLNNIQLQQMQLTQPVYNNIMYNINIPTSQNRNNMCNLPSILPMNRFNGAPNQWVICWEFNSLKGCKWGNTCYWRHVYYNG